VQLVLEGRVTNGVSDNAQLRDFAGEGANEGERISWNLRNQSGREVASGVYLIVLEGRGGRAIRKVAVIR